ncbi:CaiB/BaiF CoA transferase family protein [Pseudoroseomonas ludipueritiae]|uniref:CoA transferase n=1 Tax=Pseudoroseomonas ludipueritiae TaxID=198093 RepID=A0ABR7R5L0_9PROT|nr:CaiB/BaiF CoA-transferase family protein [Pseudoroseomonas ludipueritiae]MBC9177016.1 CoA transferase [Pseudoroseomonas ludipueritiae]
MPQPATALSRYTVLDLTRVRSGPTCVRQFADWGAKVIKIEMPEGLDEGDPMGGPRQGPDFQNLHRNKQSMTLNLKSAEGVAIFQEMVRQADVVVENFRPDVKDRLGIGYESLAEINPRLVYASISGFGQDGPYAGRPGFDQIAQGMGGLMSITGQPGQGPMRVGIPIADLCAGIFAAQGVLVALLEREISGKGQWVQTSLLQAQIFMLDFQAARWLQAGEVPKQAGNNHPTSIPTGVFPTADGYMNIAATGQRIWQRFAMALGHPEWLEDPRYAAAAARSQNRDVLNEEISAVTRGDTSANWVARLNEAGVPCGPINSIDQVFADEQVRHLGIAAYLNGGSNDPVGYVAQPMTLSRTPSSIVSHPPRHGEHTESILAGLGYTPEQIADLRGRQVV